MPIAARQSPVMHMEVIADSTAWASHIQRAVEGSKISTERMPSEVLAAMDLVGRIHDARNEEADHGHALIALHVAAGAGIAHGLLPALQALRSELPPAAQPPQLASACSALVEALPSILCLPFAARQHGEVPRQEAQRTANALAEMLGLPFTANAHDELTSPDSAHAFVKLHGHLQSVARCLMTMGHDHSAPSEALTMVCGQVIGHRQLPAPQLPETIRLLTDAITAFAAYRLNQNVRATDDAGERIADDLSHALMQLTSRLPQVA